ncbi:glycoside hydrolase family 43 protein [Catenuloplanes japonicus]|uniref:glycoside hydrolase family 43 protein n=1 Tax=Catenuloplanes japonicus TaxID=33876 RepID=UPI000A9D0206|nr:glycoside hydrolase family 43 protein [Catenuloplanes japonicus]
MPRFHPRRLWPVPIAALALVLSFAVFKPAGAEQIAPPGAEQVTAAAATGTFRNPVGAKPDPFMTYFNGNYYLAMTEGDSIKMRRAPSVAGLLNAAPVEVWRDSDASRNKEVWAPEFYRVGDRWYIYYTADNGVDENHRLYVLESDTDNPAGTYHFKARLVPPNRDVFAIDPALLQHNGKLYLAWSGTNQYQHNGLNIAPMSNPWTVSGNATALNAAGNCPEVREGPAFLYRNGRTWMTYSACDTGKPDYALWQMSIASTADPLVASNWQQRSGAVFARSDARGVFGPGHHSFFKSPDGTEDWIVYLAKTTTTFTYNNRTTRVQRIGWNSDGSPSLGVPLAIGATQDLPSGDPGPSTAWINDDGRTSGNGGLTYTGTWSSGTGCAAQCFWGDDHWSGATGATATFTFTGTQVALLSVRDVGNGIAAYSIDGGAEQRVDLYSAIRFGEVLNYLSPKLAHGTHTVRVRVTGEKNTASSGTTVSLDRAEVWTG